MLSISSILKTEKYHSVGIIYGADNGRMVFGAKPTRNSRPYF